MVGGALSLVCFIVMRFSQRYLSVAFGFVLLAAFLTCVVAHHGLDSTCRRPGLACELRNERSGWVKLGHSSLSAQRVCTFAFA